MNKKNHNGFSLMELMIGLGIIAILTAIAVPNISAYKAKAMQNEVKTNLAGYYQAAKVAYIHFGLYMGNFVTLGFRPDGVLNYRISVVNTGNPLPASIPRSASCIRTNAIAACQGGALNPLGAAFVTWTNAPITPISGPANPVDSSGTVLTPQMSTGAAQPLTFRSFGSGRIGGTAIDTWSINQAGILVNVNNGLP